MTDIFVGKAHVDALISVTLRWGPHFGEGMSWSADDPHLTSYNQLSYREISGRDDPLFLDDVGTMLLLENARSIQYRYGEYPEVEPYSFKLVQSEWIQDPEMCFRPLDAYIYYSSEHPSWLRSEAFRFCSALADTLIISLPRYGLGPWVYRRS